MKRGNSGGKSTPEGTVYAKARETWHVQETELRPG